jgi:hypothetical protein
MTNTLQITDTGTQQWTKTHLPVLTVKLRKRFVLFPAKTTILQAIGDYKFPF